MKKIIITGGSGFLGTALIEKILKNTQHEIVVLDINPPRVSNDRIRFISCDLLKLCLENAPVELKNPDVYIHLSGKNIAGRFTAKHKKLIYDTRVIGTRNLVSIFENEEYRPKKIIAASAVGYYGDQPGLLINENSKSQNGYFLSGVVRDWEHEVKIAQKYNIATTCVRNAHIIGNGGLLAEVSKTFKFYVGGVLGFGSKYLPWIDIRDLVDLYIKLIDQSSPQHINAVSGSFSTQRDFSRAIANNRKTILILPLPRFILRLRFGSFADEMLVDQKIESVLFSEINFFPKYAIIDDVIRYYLTQQK